MMKMILAFLPPHRLDPVARRLQRLESAFQWAQTTGFLRYESARKDELFPPTDLRHSELFTVRKLNVGVVRDFALAGVFDLGLGATASVHSVPGALKAEYGNRPVSYMLFTGVKL